MKKPYSRKARPKPRRALKQRKPLYDRVVEFPQARGRTVEMVELSVSDAAHVLHLRHRDHTFCAKVALQQPVRPRETVWLHFPPQHLYYFDRNDKRL